MPLQATSGAATYDAFGGGVPVVPQYIEEVFSTWLYTGTGATQTITNGIDLSTKGGMTWIKSRSAAYNNSLFDTARGATKAIRSNLTTAQVTDANSLTSFDTTGFTLGSGNTTGTQVNTSAATFASWTFRKQSKFFDVVTYSGDGGAAGRQISHNLGSVPGCMIVMSLTNLYGDPHFVYHRALDATNPQNYFLALNNTDARISDQSWNYTQPTSTYFTIGDGGSGLNGSGQTYVAYLFAHNAGGFGLTGTDNVISCGSFTTDGSGNFSVNLGYEPQWLMIKRTNSSTYGDWYMTDIMRGLTVDGSNELLYANLSNAALATSGSWQISSTGFSGLGVFPASASYIYIAIRRGPMKVPTSGTSVFKPTTYSGNNGTQTFSTGFVSDVLLTMRRTGTGTFTNFDQLQSRLTGGGHMVTWATDAEQTATSPSWDANTNSLALTSTSTSWNATSSTYVNEVFKRAPSFMDVVCYTGTGVNGQTQAHNLGVIPELIIVKNRNAADNWMVTGTFTTSGKFLDLSTTDAIANYGAGHRVDGSATTLTLGFYSQVNGAGYNYVAYLFATAAGVSKVGTYTGTATTLQVDCGFTSGARFVLIKRTDDTGDWYVWDSARGIIAGNDPYLRLNSSAAEVTNTDYVDTYSAGFEISSTAPAAINASGGSFVFLAIA